MILNTLLRWLWVAIAFCLAGLVAIIALFTLGSVWAGEAIREAAQARGDWLVWEGAHVFGALFFTGAVLPALNALPGLLAVTAGELFRIRSALYYTLAGGAALAAIPLLATSPESAGEAPAAGYMTIFAAAGFIAGFCYWLLAGRGA